MNLASQRRRRSFASLRVSMGLLVFSAVLAGGCKIEKVGSIDYEEPPTARSRLAERPAIPSMNASEESLEAGVRDELARMRGVDDPLEGVRLRVEELGLSPAGRAGGWYFPVEVERVATLEGGLWLDGPRPQPQPSPDEVPNSGTPAETGGPPVPSSPEDPSVEGEVPPEQSQDQKAGEPPLLAHLRRRKAGDFRRSLKVVDVGHGLHEPALGHDDYAGTSVAGAIALVRWGPPPNLDAAQGWNEAELLERKFAAALGAGALAAVVRVPESEMARAAELMPLSTDTARKRDEPAKPQLEFEAMLSDRHELEGGEQLRVEVDTLARWTTHQLLLARIVGAEQAEQNVTIVVEPDPNESELALYEASSVAALARQLRAYTQRGVRLRRSVTFAVLPRGAPVDEMARALLEYGPLPPQNMSSAIVLRDFVGAAAAHQARLYGVDGSDLSVGLEEIGGPLGWSFHAEAGEEGQRAFLSARVPAISVARSGELVPADASHWAESMVSETRLLLRVVLWLAREVEPIRLAEDIPLAPLGEKGTSPSGAEGQGDPPAPPSPTGPASTP